MSAEIEALNDIIGRYTVCYRKGAEVTEKNVGGIRVVEVFGYPGTPSRGELVDVHFLNVGFTEASADETAFRDALTAAMNGHGYYGDMSLVTFATGPSYIAVGGWLGDQGLALRLFALFEHYGIGRCITPAKLHIDGELAEQMAGQGYVMGMLSPSELVSS